MTAPPRDKEDPDRRKDERESAEPEREESGEGKEDKRVDREAAETFPASDPPANY